MSKIPKNHQSDKQAIASLLEHLIRMPTVSGDHATNAAALDWVENQLTGLPLNIRRLTNKGVPALVASSEGSKKPKAPRLWLAGHMDVVPGDPSVFMPIIKGQRLYGRGASDMKSGLAVFIHLLKQLGPTLTDYDLGLMITCDEEFGGFDGARWLAESGYRSDAMLLPDGGINWDVELSAKGIAWYQVEANGTSAHSSRPWLGDNAISKLVKYLDEIAATYPTEPCGDPTHSHGTFNIGTIAGGTAANQVPKQAIAHIDMRLMPGDVISHKTQSLIDLASKYQGITVTQLEGEPAYKLTYDGALKLFSRLTQELGGRQLTSSLSHASSDARHFIGSGVQVITTRATGGGHHSDEEWIDLDELTTYYRITKQFTEEWAKL